MKRISWLAALVVAQLALPSRAVAQMRVSVGGGGGIAGSTDESLSNGTGGPILMGQVTGSIVPLVGIGAEVDYWRRGTTNVTFATGLLQFHLPLTPFFVKLGAGYGSGNPDGSNNVSGVAGQLGLAYDITIPAAPIALTVFANAFLAHATAHSAQLVDGGLAITWR